MEGQDGWQVVQVVADDMETEQRLRSTWSPPAGDDDDDDDDDPGLHLLLVH